MDPTLVDTGTHLLLEGVGALILVTSYRFCEHNWHRAVVWLVLSTMLSYCTVQLVG